MCNRESRARSKRTLPQADASASGRFRKRTLPQADASASGRFRKRTLPQADASAYCVRGSLTPLLVVRRRFWCSPLRARMLKRQLPAAPVALGVVLQLGVLLEQLDHRIVAFVHLQ